MNRIATKDLFKSANGTREANPYLDARRTWNSRLDKAYNSANIWQIIAVASLLIALSAIAGMVYIGSKSKFVPFVIAIDKLGEALSVGPAQVAGSPDPRVIRASLAAFISQARLVTPDQDLQRKSILAVYALLRTKDPATHQMNEFLNGTPDVLPFERAKRVTVNAEISTVLQISQNSWQVEWQETTRDRDGGVVDKPRTWRAILEIYIDPMGENATQATIQRNPIGIYVKNYSWQQL